MCIEGQLKSKYRQAISYLLPAVSLSCQSPPQQGLPHQSWLLTPLSSVSFLHTPTHIHNFQIFIFQNAGFLQSLQQLPTYSHLLKRNTAHTLFYSGGTENKGINNQIGSRIDPANITASPKQNYLLLYTQRCCTVQRTILILYRNLVSIPQIRHLNTSCTLRC